MSKVVGVAVSIRKSRGIRMPVATVAVVEGSRSAPTVIEEFDLTTNAADVAAQIHDLASALENRLVGLTPDRVVIRRADRPVKPSNQEGPRVRLITEGALAYSARRHVADTRVLPGRDLAAQAGTVKDHLDTEASRVAINGPVEPIAAAIAVLGP